MNENETVERSLTIVDISPVPVAKRIQQIKHIKSLVKDVMVPEVHYGTIPGCKKPSLLKPGAEEIGMMYYLVPTFKKTEHIFDNMHREYVVDCALHFQDESGPIVGNGAGSCSSLESKYRYRTSERRCPLCEAAGAIITARNFKTGREEGFLCWPKKGGCGAKFDLTDKRITEQKLGQAENPDLADIWNTVLKMAIKRAYVDAIIRTTGISSEFTQDVEDNPEAFGLGGKAPSSQQAASASPTSPAKAKAGKSDLAAKAAVATKKPDAPLPENLEDFYLYNLDEVGKDFSTPDAKKEIWQKVSSKYGAKKSGSICYCPVEIPEWSQYLAGQPAANDYSDDEIQMSEMKFEDVEAA